MLSPSSNSSDLKKKTPGVYIINIWHPCHFIPLFITVILSLFYVNKLVKIMVCKKEKKNIKNEDKCEIPGYQAVYYI